MGIRVLGRAAVVGGGRRGGGAAAHGVLKHACFAVASSGRFRRSSEPKIFCKTQFHARKSPEIMINKSEE